MSHTEYYGTGDIYTNDITVLLNTGLLLIFLSKTAVYGTLTAAVLQSIIGLCSDDADDNDKLWQWR